MMTSIVTEDSAGTKHISVFGEESSAPVLHYIEYADWVSRERKQEVLWYRQNEGK